MSIVTPNAHPIDFDRWRAAYEQASFADQQTFYSQVWREHPIQRQATTQAALHAFRVIAGEDLRVVELGGWDGLLAGTCLRQHPEIVSWTNLEICREVVEHGTVCRSERYHAYALHAHVWEDPTQIPANDVLVATHTFEHLSLEHASAAIAAINPQLALYVEMPLQGKPSSWDHYGGSHVLEVGWWGWRDEMVKLGFVEEESLTATCRIYWRESDA